MINFKGDKDLEYLEKELFNRPSGKLLKNCKIFHLKNKAKEGNTNIKVICSHCDGMGIEPKTRYSMNRVVCHLCKGSGLTILDWITLITGNY